MVQQVCGVGGQRSQALKELESESNKLKKILTDKLLEVEAMKDEPSKKWSSQRQENLPPVTLDFVSDQLSKGRRFGVLNVVDC